MVAYGSVGLGVSFVPYFGLVSINRVGLFVSPLGRCVSIPDIVFLLQIIIQL